MKLSEKVKQRESESFNYSSLQIPNLVHDIEELEAENTKLKSQIPQWISDEDCMDRGEKMTKLSDYEY